MFTLQRTDSENPHFVHLVKQLDADLSERDGEDAFFYSQFNKIDALQHVVIAYSDGIPVGCGAMKFAEAASMEIKRMYTVPAFRGKGIAGMILKDLETWAVSLKMDTCKLETGKRQPEAIALYLKSGYSIIPNYGQYAGIDNSVCFEKKLIHTAIS